VAFEMAHILIFLVAMVYVVTAAFLIHALERTKRSWDAVQYDSVEAMLKEETSDASTVDLNDFSLTVS
jgi:hypothetical protein